MVYQYNCGIVLSSCGIIVTIAVCICFVTFYNTREVHECERYCYDLDEVKHERHTYGAKAAYPKVISAEISKQFKVKNCKPVKIWTVFRHGARYPSANEVTKLQKLVHLRDEVVSNYQHNLLHGKTSSNRCRLCNVDFELIKNWRSANISGDDVYSLTAQGWNDLKGLAQNYQMMFPDLFAKNYSESTYLFRHSHEKRTEASYKAFVDGLFGKNSHEYIKLPPKPQKDLLLKPYDHCTASLENSKLIIQGLPFTENFKFWELPMFKKMIKGVSKRLGFDQPLNETTIKSIWNMCQYEQSWYLHQPAAWCTAFTPSQLKMMDYYEDLFNYYQKSYGYAINTNISCLTVSDMLQQLQSPDDSPKVIAYFAHSTLIHLFLTTLGVLKDDEPPRADNYYRMHSRKYKSSEAVPFSANFAAIKYECPNDKHDKNKVMFVLNQKPLKMNWCNGRFCNLSDLKKMYNSRFTPEHCEQNFCVTDNKTDAHLTSAATTLAYARYGSRVSWMITSNLILGLLVIWLFRRVIN